MARVLLIVAFIVSAAGLGIQAHWLNGPVWPSRVITEYIQLGAAPVLFDGCADWSCSARSAMSSWNAHLGSVQFRAVPDATQGQGKQNGRNDIFFDTQVYDHAFGPDTLAITVWWYRGSTMIEGDIGFNAGKIWNSYRGSQRPGQVYDLRRVAIHELGHVLGFGHPDAHGQSITAIMNSHIGNLDDLAPDDVSGAEASYGCGGGGRGVALHFPPRGERYDFRAWPESILNGDIGRAPGVCGRPELAGQINFPPLDQTYEFRTWLESKYSVGLGRAPADSYADVEGTVAWVQEYLRYRLNRCSDAQAIERVRTQINGGGVPEVCGTPDQAVSVDFPPRDETYAFRMALEDIYRNELDRDAVTTSVGPEADGVWIQEYLRYRLHGCTHTQAVERVSLQIDGRGVQPVCR